MNDILPLKVLWRYCVKSLGASKYQILNVTIVSVLN